MKFENDKNVIPFFFSVDEIMNLCKCSDKRKIDGSAPRTRSCGGPEECVAGGMNNQLLHQLE